MAHRGTLPSITPGEFARTLALLNMLGFEEDPVEVLAFFQQEAHVEQGGELHTEEETNRMKETIKVADALLQKKK